MMFPPSGWGVHENSSLTSRARLNAACATSGASVFPASENSRLTDIASVWTLR